MAHADSTTRTSHARGTHKRLVAGLAILAALLLSAFAIVASTPSANAATTTSATGWVRVGHLSPDTKSVDVRLTSLAGGQTVYELDNVTYGQVSPYKELPVGTYTVAMTAAGASSTAKPLIAATVTVATGKPITVVAYGKNSNLKTTVFEDDLTQPAAGQSRIRLVQAATVAQNVTVKTSTGTVIAQDAPFGSASGYASVAAGAWTLDLASANKKITSTVDVNLAAGSITTLFVLDNASNGITIVPVVDSAATTTTPVGGVQTGGGYEATHPTADITWFGGYQAFGAN